MLQNLSAIFSPCNIFSEMHYLASSKKINAIKLKILYIKYNNSNFVPFIIYFLVGYCS